MGFCVLKRIQENWRGCVDQKCKKWLEGGRKSLAVRELSNSVYFAHQEDGWGGLLTAYAQCHQEKMPGSDRLFSPAEGRGGQYMCELKPGRGCGLLVRGTPDAALGALAEPAPLVTGSLAPFSENTPEPDVARWD